MSRPDERTFEGFLERTKLHQSERNRAEWYGRVVIAETGEIELILAENVFVPSFGIPRLSDPFRRKLAWRIPHTHLR